MKKDEKLRCDFKSFFVNEAGHFQHPGNIGAGRNVLPVCREILRHPEPLLRDLLSEWEDQPGKLKTADGKKVTLLNVSQVLLRVGQWEGAWAVGHLHYNQLLKQEAAARKRLHKGHPACGLAILRETLAHLRLPATSRSCRVLGIFTWNTRIRHFG